MSDIPAFPRPYSGTSQFAQEGMTLRDYFAARVLPMAIKEMNDAESYGADDAANLAYQYADSMMRAREA
jgi:hypothetical protein